MAADLVGKSLLKGAAEVENNVSSFPFQWCSRLTLELLQKLSLPKMPRQEKKARTFVRVQLLTGTYSPGLLAGRLGFYPEVSLLIL